MALIYKILPAALWADAREKGVFAGAVIDLTDGFIHFSTAGQAQETADKHFAGQADLIVFAIEAADFGPEMRWEPSRGGALFPHLYAPLPVGKVKWARPLPVGADGRHDFSGLPE